ncbi:MAG TPA: NlpC/P60 family protein [Longimicrobiales bacterium]|nr:NlpC/P60 family protein [Longimicrobiales bacterium]
MTSLSNTGGALDDVIEQVRRQFVPDFRSGIFDVVAQQDGATVVLRGQSTNPAAVTALVTHLRDQGFTPVDNVMRLPDASLGAARHALVRSAVAPVYAEPRLPAPQISQLVMGMRVELLAHAGDWYRIRGEDGYIGWAYQGYLLGGDDDWAFAWERGSSGESVVSLGAELIDADGRIIARLPWGARLTRHSGAYHLPDGRSGMVANGDVVDVDRLGDWFPHRGESIARTARRWYGAPYLWGGVTLNGVDCSGFTQAVMWMHGIALPRDSDLQERAGTGVALDLELTELRPGDLLFFAEPGARVSHVAISLGGPLIIHSALGNGGVHINDLAGTEPLEHRLAAMFVSARRLLAD